MPATSSAFLPMRLELNDKGTFVRIIDDGRVLHRIRVTAMQGRVLNVLLQRNGDPISVADLAAQIGSKSKDHQSVYVYISTLRRAIEPHSDFVIAFNSGDGYTLDRRSDYGSQLF